MSSSPDKVGLKIIALALTIVLFLGAMWAAVGIHIFIHEAGHYVAFKRYGIGVSQFQVGVGPSFSLGHFRETDVRFGILPLGGYNLPYFKNPINGERPADDLRTANEMTQSERFVVGVSGITMNIAVLVLSFFVAAYARPRTDYANSLRYESYGTYRNLLAWLVHVLTLTRYPAVGTRLERARSRFFHFGKGWKRRPLYTASRLWIYISALLIILNMMPFGPLDGAKFWPALLAVMGVPPLPEPIGGIVSTVSSYIGTLLILGPFLVTKKGSKEDV